MKIEHLAIWVNDLEKMKDFYIRFFGVTANNKYHNPTKQFSSYFLSFKTGTRIELMYKPDISNQLSAHRQNLGYAHFAISVGSKDQVDQLTEKIRLEGFKVVGEPRTTGDGYYESVISDPEGNLIEVTI